MRYGHSGWCMPHKLSTISEAVRKTHSTFPTVNLACGFCTEKKYYGIGVISNINNLQNMSTVRQKNCITHQYSYSLQHRHKVRHHVYDNRCAPMSKSSSTLVRTKRLSWGGLFPVPSQISSPISSTTHFDPTTLICQL